MTRNGRIGHLIRTLPRHGRTCSGHPRLSRALEVVDARAKHGHDDVGRAGHQAVDTDMNPFDFTGRAALVTGGIGDDKTRGRCNAVIIRS